MKFSMLITHLELNGVTTNPRHIMLSGKPFMKAITDIAEWIKSVGLEGIDKFPVSVEINPHLDDADEMVEMAKEVSAISPNFVIKIPAVESGITAARRLEKMGIRTNVTLVFSPAQAILPAKNGSLFVSPFIGWKEANGEDCREYIKNIVEIYKNYGSIKRRRLSVPLSAHRNRLLTVLWREPILLPPGLTFTRIR